MPSYHDAPGLVEAFSARVQDGLSRWPEGERERVHVVFSAHSLPQRVLASGDPYGDQCDETARLVAARAGLLRRALVVGVPVRRSHPGAVGRSRSRRAPGRARVAGRPRCRLVPVGFVSDHVEILFDIDHKAAAVAAELGMRLERPPALNDDPVFIAALAQIVRDRAAPWSEGAQAA